MEENKMVPKKMPPKPAPPKVRPVPPKKEAVVDTEVVEEPKVEVAEVQEEQETEIKQSVQTQSIEIKKEKVKKVKTPKQKNISRKSSKKKLIIILVCVIVLAAGGGVAGWFLLGNKGNDNKLQTPTLKVEQLYNGTVLEASKIESAVSYEFELTNLSDNSKENLPLFSKNVVELKSYLSKVGSYSVKVRALGKTTKAHSDYSEPVTFKNYKQLQTPQIDVLNMNVNSENSLLYKTNEDTAPEGITNDKISWSAVANADYYVVRYGANIENETINTIIVDKQDGMVNFDLNKIYNNGTGSYQISVVAMPAEDSYYLASEYQKIVTVEYYSQRDDIEEADYNKETKILEFRLDSDKMLYGNEFEVYLTYANETKEHKIYLDKCEKVDNLTYRTSLYQIDNGNVVSIRIKTLGDGRYSTDSNAIDVTIN